MQLIVKTKFGDDLRRFNVKPDVLLKDICVTTCDLYRLPNVRLKYRDEEGDLITLTTDNELREAINLAEKSKPPFLRLEVESCEVELNDSWIVLPNENVNEFPPIFAFQLPVFDDDLEKAFQHLSVDQHKPLSEQLHPIAEQNSEELRNVPTFVVPTLVIPTRENKKEELEIKTVILENLTPQTRKKLKEICVDLVIETKTSCVDLSNETLRDLMPYWKSTVLNSHTSSDEIRQQCLDASDRIMDQTRDIPCSIVLSSSIISTETSNSCLEASASVMKACLNLSQLSTTDPDLWSACTKLSDQTSRDCQDLASKLVAEILAL